MEKQATKRLMSEPTEATYKLKLPKGLLKTFGLQPGDRLEVVIDEDGNGVAFPKAAPVARATFGVWADEMDGVEYMDKMRAAWERPRTP